MKFEIKKIYGAISKDKIIEDIIRVDRILNKDIMTKTDYCKHSKVSSNTVNKFFGSWHDALVAADLSSKSNLRIPTSKQKQQESKFLSNDDILEEMKNIAKKLGKQTITGKELNENSMIISGSTVRNRFGWKNGLKLAGLEVTPLGKRYSEKECFDNLLNVWSYYGRQPTAKEMSKKPSVVGHKAYINRWGSWIKSLESFVEKEKVNKTPEKTIDTEIDSITFAEKSKKANVKNEGKRDIPDGIRYDVLRRNNFKCVICGDHPATNPKCKLHVDHIKPFSKGGKTKIENLRTLCSRCNIGKSDKSDDLQI